MMEYRPSLPRKVAGWSLLGLGVLGAVLPVLQGALFFALGLFVLRHQYLWAHRGLAWAERRWPHAVARVEGMEARLIASARSRWQRVGAWPRRRFRRG
jgi:uncharacterized membrane protein YbaN (DUF454 family)